ncbi:MAG TPA: hypothetical protein VFH68_01770 [Polyangia bacterium]|jgi:hypothetical protein|nr:hypothetical protein [Polyangia bacterium]
MEPPPLLPHDPGATPAPQVELLETDDGSGPADAGIDRPGLDVSFTSATPYDEGEAPYLRQRTEAAGGATPTPMVDLTDLAVALPETPAPIAELRPLPALDPADATAVTPLPIVTRPSRVTLSRPRLAGLGVLAFSAGLLTAATAGVLARPARTVPVVQSAPPAPARAPIANLTGASAPVLVATEVTAPAAAAPEVNAAVAAASAPTEARDAIEPAAPPPAPVTKTVAAPAGKAHGKTAAPVRGRARTPTPGRSGTSGDSLQGESTLVIRTTAGAEPGDVDVKRTPRATAPKRQANWVDPFAE